MASKPAPHTPNVRTGQAVGKHTPKLNKIRSATARNAVSGFCVAGSLGATAVVLSYRSFLDSYNERWLMLVAAATGVAAFKSSALNIEKKAEISGACILALLALFSLWHGVEQTRQAEAILFGIAFPGPIVLFAIFVVSKWEPVLTAAWLWGAAFWFYFVIAPPDAALNVSGMWYLVSCSLWVWLLVANVIVKAIETGGTGHTTNGPPVRNTTLAHSRFATRQHSAISDGEI